MTTGDKLNIWDILSFKFIKKARRRQVMGLSAGLLFSTAVISTLVHPANEEMHCRGPLNTGHEKLECSACHTRAAGTMRQQLQASVKYTLGLRKSEADFGKADVSNKACLDCHTRDNDRHPVHRFTELRFEEARKKYGVDKCESCHREHQGVRVTLADFSYCQECHSDMKVENDPLDVPHTELIKNKNWNTCMQCHDFHGNHKMVTPSKLKDTISQKAILAYFGGSRDPFSSDKIYKAKNTTQNEK